MGGRRPRSAPPQPAFPDLGAPALPRGALNGRRRDARGARPGPAPGSRYLRAPPGSAGPRLAAAPRRGRGGAGRAGLNAGGAGLVPRSERTGCRRTVERAGGAPELPGSWAAPEGNRADCAALGPRPQRPAWGLQPVVALPRQPALRGGRCGPGRGPPPGVRVGGTGRASRPPPSGFLAGRVRLSGRDPARPAPPCPHFTGRPGRLGAKQ